MPSLDTALRTPGQVLLIERNSAQMLVDRAFEERRQPSGGNLLSRAIGAVARIGRAKAMEDDGDDGETIDRSKLAMPQISWAGTVEWADGYAIVDGIAVVDINGVLTPTGYFDFWEWTWCGGYAQISAAIAAARADDRVHALFLRVNSPGGLVDGCFDLVDEIAGENGGAGGKPVWVHTRMACSAAYALASAADRIVATAEADVGSIGVLVLHVDVSGFYDEHGIKFEAIQSGARKTDGAEWKPLSDDARAHLQGVVDQIARRFTAAVSANRDITADAVVALQAQWFLAQHDDAAQSGLALKLVDEIASERAAFAALKQSLTSSTGGAPAGSGSQAASDAPRATTTETEMGLREQITALREKAAKGDAAAIAELKAMGVSLKADAAEGDDGGGDEGDDEKKKKDGDDEGGDDDEDDEPEASATGTKAGFALLRADAAKGRADLANQLAAKVAGKKLTYGEAVKMLASTPKSKPLADAMAGRDRNPGNDGGEAPKSGAGLGAAIDRMNAKKTSAR